MAIPQLSPEARAEALEKAKAARIKRAEVREELKTGKLTVAQVLDMRDDPVVGPYEDFPRSSRRCPGTARPRPSAS